MEPEATLSSKEREYALLEENLELSRRIYESTERARKYILWGQVLSVVKLLIVMVPLVWGVLLLRPYLQTAFGAYREILGAPSQGSADDSLLQQLQNSGIDSKTLEKYLK